MIRVVPFQAEHGLRIEPQPAQAEAHAQLTPEHWMRVQAEGPAFTLLDDEQVLFIGGAVTPWPNRHVLWSVFSRHACSRMITIVRGTARFIEQLGLKGRCEIAALASFVPAQRLARMLGFHGEHVAERFFPDGSNAIIYVRFF
jgi:hypothetical protein